MQRPSASKGRPWGQELEEGCSAVLKRGGENKISRRRVLSVISGSVCAAIELPRTGHAAAVLSSPFAIPQHTSGTSTAIFAQPQMETIATLCELIIPADQHSPGARAARVDQYIDDIVRVSDAATQKQWIEGLAALDALAKRQYSAVFTACHPDHQAQLLETLSKGEDNPSTPEERFFETVKLATIAGYYNSDIGIHQDLQYQGNTFVLEFPGCTHAAHRNAAR